MAQMYTELSARHCEFIAAQKMYFVGTATADSRINVSPKGMDSLRVMDPQRVAWLNVTGSGNETSAHVQADARMTLMFCAFEGAPMILRLYGKARVVHFNDPDWAGLYARFNPLPGARQIFDSSSTVCRRPAAWACRCTTTTPNADSLKPGRRKKAMPDCTSTGR